MGGGGLEKQEKGVWGGGSRVFTYIYPKVSWDAARVSKRTERSLRRSSRYSGLVRGRIAPARSM